MLSVPFFLSRWQELDVTEHITLEFDDPWLLELRERVISFLSSLLHSNQKFLRKDYQEMAELCLTALGIEPPRGKRFMRPGACHNARWMAKASAVLY